MRHPKFLVFCLLLCSASLSLKAQNSVPDCEDIKVEVKTISTSNNRPNGSIEMIFTKSFDSYRIFHLNAGSDKTGKEELKSDKLTNLKAGFFDFLIMDKNKKGCVRQLTVDLK
jgi:hypothetical protein